ncbi:MAG: RHS repeat-associated core domain-containing protein, partial [Acidobacteriota bacterium]
RTQHFFGFGEPTDLAASNDPERKRFTGHERDLGTLGGAGGVQVELDYMRARFCSPWTARFLSVDPARESAHLQRPQTWNRYSYAFNNPVTLVDPDGQVPILFKTAVKLAIKGGDIAATTAGIVEDAKTLVSPDASASDRALAAASLLSEVVSPVSARDVRSGIQAVEAVGDTSSVARGADYVDLASPSRRGHILDGDRFGGGHRAGTGRPGKSEFPSDWSDDRVMHAISDVATDPNSKRRPGEGGRTIVEGVRDGVLVRVIQEGDGTIVTGFPTNRPRNPKR